ncbi:MAG: hypothetical protein N3B01_08425 [Verrucomicrobiae bacterium]|nr:hypothetical protein [Verrucomicrobiae bacterium]
MKSLIFVLLWCLAASVWADTLLLKDGTVVHGNIVAETDTEYVVERSLAGGTIKTKTTYRKADVSEVSRSRPEEKAAAAAKQAYEATKRYQLDPNASFSKDHYERVINGVLRKFLADYPDSPFAAEVRERLAAWEAERDKVAAGMIKRNGRWFTASEVAADNAAQLLAQARSALTQHRYDVAVPLLEQLGGGSAPADLVATAQQLRAKAYQDWIQSLRQALETLQENLETNSVAVAAAKEDLDNTRTALRDADAKLRAQYGGLTGTALQAEHQKVAAAQKKLAELERKQSELALQLAAVKRTLAQVQGRMAELNIPATPIARAEPASQLPPPSPPPSPPLTLMERIRQISKDYWWMGVLGLLLVVWFVLRRW